MTAILILTAISLIGVVMLIAKGIRDAKEIESDNLGLSQKEIDIYKSQYEKQTPDLCCGIYEGPENEREFKNRSDIDEVDMSYTNHCH